MSDRCDSRDGPCPPNYTETHKFRDLGLVSDGTKVLKTGLKYALLEPGQSRGRVMVRVRVKGKGEDGLGLGLGLSLIHI